MAKKDHHEQQTPEATGAAHDEPVENVEDQAETIAATAEEKQDTEQITLERLQAALEKAETAAAKSLDGWQRAQATFENYRRRTEAEREKWAAEANAILLARLLPILDDFDRAFDNAPEEIAEHQWLSGVRLVQQKLQRVLDIEGVESIAVAPGDPFDPGYHQAVLTQITDAFEEDHIIAVTQNGYRQGEHVLRPAMVVVAKAPPMPEPNQEAEDESRAAENPEPTAV